MSCHPCFIIELFANIYLIMMQHELEAVEHVMTHLLHTDTRKYLTERKIAKFGRCLKRVLYRRWIHSWNPYEPHIGQALRTLWVNEDNIPHYYLIEACEACHIYFTTLLSALPYSWTIWVNPGQVLYRTQHTAYSDIGAITTAYQDPTVNFDALV